MRAQTNEPTDWGLTIKIWLGCANIVMGVALFAFSHSAPSLGIIGLLALGSSVLGFDAHSRLPLFARPAREEV